MIKKVATVISLSFLLNVGFSDVVFRNIDVSKYANKTGVAFWVKDAKVQKWYDQAGVEQTTSPCQVKNLEKWGDRFIKIEHKIPNNLFGGNHFYYNASNDVPEVKSDTAERTEYVQSRSYNWGCPNNQMGSNVQIHYIFEPNQVIFKETFKCGMFSKTHEEKTVCKF